MRVLSPPSPALRRVSVYTMKLICTKYKEKYSYCLYATLRHRQPDQAVVTQVIAFGS